MISEPTTGRGVGLGEKKASKNQAQRDSRIITLRGDRESWSANQQADRQQSTKRPADDGRRAKQTVREEKTERKDEKKEKRRSR